MWPVWYQIRFFRYSLTFIECAHARRERREAVEASSQAMESQEMLTQQVDLLRREKDLALRQVAELRKGDIAGKLKDGIRFGEWRGKSQLL